MSQKHRIRLADGLFGRPCLLEELQVGMRRLVQASPLGFSPPISSIEKLDNGKLRFCYAPMVEDLEPNGSRCVLVLCAEKN